MVLGPSWGRLGPSWALLGPSWRLLGPSWGLLGSSWSRLRAILGVLTRKAAMLKNHRKTQVGRALGLSKMGPSWAKLGPSCDLEPSWSPSRPHHIVLIPSCLHLVVFMSFSSRLKSRLGPSWSRLGADFEDQWKSHFRRGPSRPVFYDVF